LFCFSASIVPFRLIYRTDGTEGAVAAVASSNVIGASADTANTGFCLNFEQKTMWNEITSLRPFQSSFFPLVVDSFLLCFNGGCFEKHVYLSNGYRLFCIKKMFYRVQNDWWYGVLSLVIFCFLKNIVDHQHKKQFHRFHVPQTVLFVSTFCILRSRWLGNVRNVFLEKDNMLRKKQNKIKNKFEFCHSVSDFLWGYSFAWWRDYIKTFPWITMKVLNNKVRNVNN
jgi:hypothetical protein